MAGKGFSNYYGGVEITYGPNDPWSGLFRMRTMANDIANGHGSEANIIAAKVSGGFLKSAKAHYRRLLQQDTGEMYQGYFCRLRRNGDLIFGNEAISQTSGEPYPTHLEYGFWNVKTGKRVPPKPTIRPAIKIAINDYKDNVSKFIYNSYFSSHIISNDIHRKTYDEYTPREKYNRFEFQGKQRYDIKQTSEGYTGRTTFY